MGKPVKLKVGDRDVLSTEVTYEDLEILYRQYIDKYGEVPLTSLCDSKHNMPQGRIIKRVLVEKGITYNDFLLKFGKVSHVRTESKDYDLYVKRYKEISNKLGHYLSQSDLMNNSYGLPGYLWFIKYCPDKSVKSFTDFVKWCGYDIHYALDKEFVSKKLIEKEKELGRHITRYDISLEKIGFSGIVINRIWGNLGNAKKELGLLETPPSTPPLPFEIYKGRLDSVLNNISKHTNRDYISWADIESPLYSDVPMEHKTLTKAFKREGVDIFSYIKSKGFMMNPSNFSYHYTFDDGERVVSTMEYDFSQYLRSLGLKYGEDYFRDVMYKTFSGEKSKMNCDYKIIINSIPLYVEIAGIIYNCKEDKWFEHTFSSKQENTYRDKMVKKEKLLIDSKQNYILLFKDNMVTDEYKNILQNKIRELLEKVA